MSLPRDSLPHLMAAELKVELANNEDILLVDVRTREEYDGGHLRGALLIPCEKMESAARDGKLGSTENRIVIYCRSGNRTTTTLRTMLKLGYTNIRHLDDGFQAWFKLGLTFYTIQGEVKGVHFEKYE